MLMHFHPAALLIAGMDTCNMYCRFCKGLFWAPVPFVRYHFDGCPLTAPESKWIPL